MKKGISPIVAVVLLIAIAVIAAVGLYFWVGGLATKQPTPSTPGTISAICQGSVLTVSNTGANTILSADMVNLVNTGTVTVESDAADNSCTAGGDLLSGSSCTYGYAASGSGTVYGAAIAAAAWSC